MLAIAIGIVMLLSMATPSVLVRARQLPEDASDTFDVEPGGVYTFGVHFELSGWTRSSCPTDARS